MKIVGKQFKNFRPSPGLMPLLSIQYFTRIYSSPRSLLVGFPASSILNTRPSKLRWHGIWNVAIFAEVWQFYKSAVTMDESWVSFFTPEMKAQSMQWLPKGAKSSERSQGPKLHQKIHAYCILWLWRHDLPALALKRSNHQLDLLLQGYLDLFEPSLPQEARKIWARLDTPPRQCQAVRFQGDHGVLLQGDHGVLLQEEHRNLAPRTLHHTKMLIELIFLLIIFAQQWLSQWLWTSSDKLFQQTHSICSNN